MGLRLIYEFSTENSPRRYPFRLVEDYPTCEGTRTRFTSHAFQTLELAQSFLETFNEKELEE